MKVCVLTALLIAFLSTAQVFYDDFEDNYIGDWEERCEYGNWYAAEGMAQCENALKPGALVIPGGTILQDVQVQAYGTAQHVFGLIARLDVSDSGLFAYVSPDHNVARIRLIENGHTGQILYSIYYDFPEDTFYNLTFTCIGDSLHFLIEIPDSDMSWEFSAVDPYPHPGEVGIATAEELHALWDWFSVSQPFFDEVGIMACVVNDSAMGNGNMAFEAGETVDLGLAIYNGGPEDLENAMAVLQSLSPELGVIVSSVEYGTIEAGSVSWSESDYVIEAFTGTPEGVTYPMRVSLFADAGYLSQHEFELPVGEGISASFEGGAEDWSSYALDIGWGDQWHVSDARNHTPGGSTSFKCGDSDGGDYSDLLFSGLVSPPFNVALGSNLTFWMWIDAQCVRSMEDALDGGTLQIGQFGNWEDLIPDDGYPYQIVSGTTGPFEPGTGVYSGTHGWQQVSVQIPDSLCGPRQLRWVFGSDVEGNREGWYIDDISVVSSQVYVGDPTVSGDHLTLRTFPNPSFEMIRFEISCLPQAGVSIDIYDLTGRIVWTASGQSSISGSLVLDWGFVSGSGYRIPAGIYTAVVRSGDESLITRIVKAN